MINDQLRKFKKKKCENCDGFYYPLYNDQGLWDQNESNVFVESVIDPLNLDDEFSDIDWAKDD